VAELVSLLRLEGLERRYPDEVSGGQQQRVALARALAARPEVLLLDEPFSALDARVREELRDWLRGLHDQLQVTSLFVTHDQTEAIELADRIAIMRDGVLVQSGAAAEIEEEPNSAFVMNFLGKASTVRGLAKDGVADFYGVTAPYEAASNGPVPVVGHFRPQQVGITLEPTSTSWPVVVDRLVAAGHAVKLNLSIVETDESFVAEISGWQRDELGLEAGRLVHATPWNLRVYPTADAEKGLRTLDPASASA
jgi:sulfate transport system ATP-binding protein